MKRLLLIGILIIMTLTGCSQPQEVEEVAEIPIDYASEVIRVAMSSVKPVETPPAFYLTNEERWYVECMVMGEAGGEPYEGQLMVAYCILNACHRSDLQPSEVKVQYKYSGWKENPSESVKQAVSEIFDFGARPVDDTPIWFYSPKLVKGTPWHETQRWITTIGNHKFFGEWGE